MSEQLEASPEGTNPTMLEQSKSHLQKVIGIIERMKEDPTLSTNSKDFLIGVENLIRIYCHASIFYRFTLEKDVPGYSTVDFRLTIELLGDQTRPWLAPGFQPLRTGVFYFDMMDQLPPFGGMTGRQYLGRLYSKPALDYVADKVFIIGSGMKIRGKYVEDPFLRYEGCVPIPLTPSYLDIVRRYMYYSGHDRYCIYYPAANHPSGQSVPIFNFLVSGVADRCPEQINGPSYGDTMSKLLKKAGKQKYGRVLDYPSGWKYVLID